LEEKTLSQLVEDLPTYYNTKIKVPVPADKKEKILPIILESTKEEQRITIDGVKLFYDDGWILVRPSGTEPLWRSFAEGKTQKISDALCNRGVQLIKSALDTLWT
jgi:phosphomannomutase/phosphoglucomutase